MRSLILILFIFIQTCVFAQGTLIFCEQVDSSGEPVNRFESLILSPEGQTIRLLYHSTTDPLGTPQIKLEVAALKNYSFSKTDLQSIFVDPGKVFLSIPYNIKSAGDYRFRILNQKDNVLAEEILSVSIEMTEAGNSHETIIEGKERELPDYADLRFSDGIQDHYNTEFSFRSTHGKIKLTLEPFDEANPIRILDIWQSEGDQYKQFIRSEKAIFIREGEVGIYELSFPAMKDFKVDVHTSDNTLITSGFVSFK